MTVPKTTPPAPKELLLPNQPIPTPEPSPAISPLVTSVPNWLSARGIELCTCQIFEIREEGNGVSYPTYHPDGTLGRRRWKHQNSNGSPKYQWKGTSESPVPPGATAPIGYGLNLVKPGDWVWIVGGEMDVWTMVQAGFSAVAAFGEKQSYDGITRALKELGAKGASILLDNDSSGHCGSLKAARAAQEAGLLFAIFDISGAPRNDVNKVWGSFNSSKGEFIGHIAGLADFTIDEWMERLRVDDANPESTKIAEASPPQKSNEENELALAVPATNNIKAQKPETQFDPPINAAAFHGVAGQFVRLIEPETETHPMAVLVQLLVGFSALIGRGAFFRVERSTHHLRLYTVLVGLSAKARKGTSWKIVLSLLEELDSEWKLRGIASGLSTGEGLVHVVRDSVEETKHKKDETGDLGVESVVIDVGVEDKRVIVVEEEFASPLRTMQRDGNTLSAAIRKLWDDGSYRFMTKSRPIETTNSHVCIIGHIVAEELKKLMSSIEIANGFANRFLWIHTKRMKLLPNGGNWDSLDFNPILTKLQQALDFGKNVGELKRDAEASALWNTIYHELAEEKAGLVGVILGRGEAQIMRLACVYAILDCSHLIRRSHLEAAYAIWQYNEQSVLHVFGDTSGDPVENKVLDRLKSAGKAGMTMTEINRAFSKNVKSEILRGALEKLKRKKQVRPERVSDKEGRPTETWFTVES